MFKPVYVNARDLNDAYFSLLWQLWENGREYKITSGSFAGAKRLEFDFVSGFIVNPHTRPLAPIMPRNMNPVTTDEKIESYFANYLMDPTREANEHYKYSTWLNSTEKYFDYNVFQPEQIGNRDYEFNKETPIEWVIRHFKEKGYGNNHCYINIGQADSGFAYEIRYKHESERHTSPCFRGIDFKIKDDHLITSVIFRSWDLFSGFPENMGGFTLLNEYVASSLDGVKPGPLAFTSAGLHAYDFQIEPIASVLNKERK
jgi:hypothetical protein